MKREIEQRIEHYSDLISKNFNQLEDFYSHSFMEFCELNLLKFEILNCLLFELYQSSIFSTNHFLERMIKLSLIKLHTIEYDFSDMNNYKEKLKESEKEYDHLVLYKSLKKALEYKLITKTEYDYLMNAKDEIRNPYSHAEISTVNKNDNDFRGFMFSISDGIKKLKEGKPLDIPNPTIIPKFNPAMAQMLQEINSKELAFDYFKNVFNILQKIENRITELKNKKH